jgi:glycerol-3-phosphate acyltransferase PlsY
MSTSKSRLLLWSPRVVGIAVCAFLSVFALDAFGGGKGLAQALPDFAAHVAPTLVLLAIVGISWRYEWVGAIAFTSLAIAYAYFARDHASWIVAIAAPLLVVGLLFYWSWRHHEELRTAG